MRLSYMPLPLKAALFASLLVSLAAACGCAGKKEPPKASPPVPVTTALAASKDVPVEVRAIGNVEAYSTVSIKSLAAGEVTRVYFKEGQDVKKGGMLFKIDPRPIEAALRQASALLAKDEAGLGNAEVEAARYDELLKKGMVSREQYDQFRTTAVALKETVNADKAAIMNTKVSLGYTDIRSPIDGRTGNLNVHEGNVVKENDTPYLVVINQVVPINVSFSVPEGRLSEIRARMAHGALKVGALIPGDAGGPAEGTLSFVDNQVDASTGTIRLKGTFKNQDRRLWPGQFVSVVVTLTTRKDATVVPSQAVQAGQAGQYVFVVKPDLTVEVRAVIPGGVHGDLTVVEDGLRPGEKVVTDGQLRLVPGAKVQEKPSLQPPG